MVVAMNWACWFSGTDERSWHRCPVPFPVCCVNKPLERMWIMNVRTVLIMLAAVGSVLLSATMAQAAVPAEWQTKTPAELVTMAGEFREAGDGGQANRVLLIEHLNTKYIADATAIKTVTAGQWKSFCLALTGDMVAATKAQWATKLRAGVVGSTQALAAISAADFNVTSGTLGKLGDTGIEALAAAFVSASTAWKTATDAHFVVLVRRVGVAAGGAAARAKLASHLVATYMADDEAARKIGPRQWSSTARILAGSLSAEDKTKCIARLRSAFAGTPAAAGALDHRSRSDLTRTLNALGDKLARNTEVSYVTGSTAWQSHEPDKFVALVQRMGSLGEAGAAARASLVAYIPTGYLADAAAVKRLSVAQWSVLAGRLGKDLDAQAKAQWVAGLRSGYAASSQAMASMDTKTCVSLFALLKSLGDTQAANVAAMFTEGSTAWKSATSAEIVALVQNVTSAGAAGTGALDKLGEHITATYIASDAAAIGMGLSRWRTIVASTREVLTAKTRDVWAARLRSAFASQDMDMRTMSAMLSLLRSLGDPDSMRFVVAWLAQQDSLQTRSIKDIAALVKMLDKAGETAGAAEQLTRLQQEVGRRLGDSEALVATGLGPWSKLLVALASKAPGETKAAWALAMRQAFIPTNSALEAMAASDCAGLMSVLRALDDANASALALTWIKGTDRNAWSEEKLTDVITSLVAAGSADKAAVTAAMNELGVTALTGELTAERRLIICRAFVTAWRDIKDMTLAQQWAIRAYEIGVGTEAARAAATSKTLSLVGGLLERAGLIGPDQSYPAYAAALAGVARSGKIEVCDIPWYSPQQALPVSTASTRETVQATLLDSEGNPRLPVAVILAWSYRNAKDFKTWRSIADVELAKESVTGDTRALWLMIDAHNRTMISFEPEAKWGIGSLTQAFGCAESEPVRLNVIRQIAIYYQQMKDPAAGASVIESIKNQFTGEALAEIETLQKSLAASARAAKAKYEANRRVVVARRRASALADYRRYLAVAEAAGDEARAQRIRAAIEKLEK